MLNTNCSEEKKKKSDFHITPHNSGGVRVVVSRWSSVKISLSIFSFPDNNLSICIDIVEIWFGMSGVLSFQVLFALAFEGVLAQNPF